MKSLRLLLIELFRLSGHANPTKRQSYCQLKQNGSSVDNGSDYSVEASLTVSNASCRCFEPYSAEMTSVVFGTQRATSQAGRTGTFCEALPLSIYPRFRIPTLVRRDQRCKRPVNVRRALASLLISPLTNAFRASMMTSRTSIEWIYASIPSIRSRMSTGSV